jgi:hypothetical protein
VAGPSVLPALPVPVLSALVSPTGSPAWAAVPSHGVGNRGDLPLPFTALVVAALAVLVISFVAIGALWREPRLRPSDGLLLPAWAAAVLDSRIVRIVARSLAVLLTIWVLIALVLGADTANNPVGHVVYVWLWVGLAFLSMAFGPVWRVLNPLRLLHAGLLRVARVGDDLAAAPYRLGLWPAALGLAAFTWLELVAEDNTTLPVLRVAIGAYLAITVVGSLVFGRVWFDHADPFEAWSRLLGLLSPLGRRADGRWVLRTPLHGVNQLRGQRGLIPTVAVMLGSTAYDGFSANLSWATFVQTSSLPPGLLKTATFVAFCALVAVTLWLAACVSMWLAGRPIRDAVDFTSDLAPSLIPIAGGYVVAHYWSLAVYQGQVTLARLSNPFGEGPDLLGLADLTPNAALIQPTLVASIQAVSIVLGHLFGVLAAHERAITVLDRRSAVVGQVPLMVVMIGYTLGGLTLLFTP